MSPREHGDRKSLPTWWVKVVACALALVGGFGFAQDDRIVLPVEGKAFVGELVAVDDDWGLTFQADGGPRRIAAADLVRWGTLADLGGDALILLVGGGALAADVRTIESEHLVANCFLFGEVRLPLARLRGVVFRPPPQRLERDRLLDHVAQSTGARDRLLLENGDVVEGLLAGGGRPAVQGPPPPRENAVLKSLRMQLDTGATDIPVDRVKAIIFNPSLVETPQLRGLRMWLGFEHDGFFVVERIASQDGLISLTLPGGIRLQTDDEGFRESVQFLQPLGGNTVYLSDLVPIGYRHIPYLTLSWDYGQDRNVLGGRLRSGGQVYLKGLGMHSTSRLAYRLENGRQRFKAALALDDTAERKGSVIYRVYGADTAGEWQPLYESPVIRGGDPPLPISVDVSTSRGLALIVEYADRGDMQDHANWLDARLE